MIDILQEFLVKIGFAIDAASVTQAEKTVDKAVEGVQDTVDEAGKAVSQTVQKTGQTVMATAVTIGQRLTNYIVQGLAKNPALQGLKNKITGVLSRFVSTFGPMIARFLSSTQALILGGIAAISGAVVALGAAIAGISAKIMHDAAKADIQIQLLARRLFTTVENARSLQAVMNQMGVKDIEGLNDIALNPELRKQFLELRELAASLELGGEQKQGFKNIRALGLEFQKLGLIMEYFWQTLGADLGALLEGPLRDIQKFMARINGFLQNNMPSITHSIAGVVGILGNLFSISVKLATLWASFFFDVDRAQEPLQILDDLLSLLNAQLAAFGRFLDIITAKIQDVRKALSFENGLKIGGEIGGALQDPFGLGKDSLEKIARFAQKIYDLLSFIWNTVRRFVTEKLQGAQKAVNTASSVGEWLTNPIGKITQEAAKGALNVFSKGGDTSNLQQKWEKIEQNLFSGKGPTSLQFLKAAVGVVDGLVTSSTGGRHNRGSKHYTGEAVDIDHKTMTPAKLAFLQAIGIKVRDEVKRPSGQKEWHGPHYHLEFTAGKIAQRMQEIKQQRQAHVQQQQQQAQQPVDKRTTSHVQEVTIQINGFNRDPQELASAIDARLRQRDTLSTRNQQGVFV